MFWKFLLMFMSISLNLTACATATKKNSQGIAVNGLGTVILRGTTLNENGMMFCGDLMETRNKSYARANFPTGDRVELAADTELMISRDCQKKVRLTLWRGGIGFVAKKEMTVFIGSYQLDAGAGAMGNLAFTSKNDVVAIRVMNGSVRLRNLKHPQRLIIQKGQERLVNLKSEEVQGLRDLVISGPMK